MFIAEIDGRISDHSRFDPRLLPTWVEMHGDIWDLGWIPNLVSHPVLPDVDLRIQAKTSNRIHAESQQHHPVKKPVTEPILNKTAH